MIEVVFYGFVLGFVMASLGKLLDFTLDYGHVFSSFRMWLARRAAMRLGVLGDFEKSFQSIMDQNFDFATNLDQVDSLYWTLHRDKMFKGWICNICLAVRLNFIVSLIITIMFIIASVTPLFLSIALLPISLASGYFFTLLLNRLS